MPGETCRRIDYVMSVPATTAPRRGSWTAGRVLDHEVGGVPAGDHYGVLADLEIPPRPPGSTRI
jgi:hypothetical protein